MTKNFEPYFDWAEISQEMATDLYDVIADYETAKKNFLKHRSPDAAGKFLEQQHKLSGVADAIYQTIYTKPVMVHVAGARVDDDDENVVQRCKLCGSILQLWHDGLVQMTGDGPRQVTPDDMEWWDEGDRVAKSHEPMSMNMYLVAPGRDLEKHELPCPNLSELA